MDENFNTQFYTQIYLCKFSQIQYARFAPTQFLTQVCGTGMEQVVLNDGEITLYRRPDASKRGVWQCKLRLKGGASLRRSTKSSDLDAAKAFALELYSFEVLAEHQVVSPEKHSFENGDILLYRRTDTVNGPWQARIKTPKGDWLVKSTRHNDLAEALSAARDLKREVEIKERHGIPYGRHKFSRIWRKWLDERGVYYTQNRIKTFEGFARRYFFEYFDERAFDLIDDLYVEKYWSWRINYWRSHSDELQRLSGKVAVEPSSALLYAEKDALSQFFKWAERNKFIARKPQLEVPVKLERNRRPALEHQQWVKFLKKAKEWERESPRPQHFVPRTMARLFCELLVHSGLRPLEAKTLRWRDFSAFKDENGQNQLVIHVNPARKTGERDTVPMPVCWSVVEELIRFQKKHQLPCEPDSWVFCNFNGTQLGAIERPVEKAFEFSKITHDRFGRKFSAYSFRHTYATFRLLYGDNVDAYTLAKNMGTSVEMIEKHYGHVSNMQKATVLTSVRKNIPEGLDSFQARMITRVNKEKTAPVLVRLQKVDKKAGGSPKDGEYFIRIENDVPDVRTRK
ncbi:tyrosine-type recombinase/integrase [Magnetospirillum sp. XM-1]|uniref:tyrosine-type recombinase/integrase n=1 Tax=Magnetospirillum sp. XM-1 TaxID=1663591 RepID=UPI00083990DF|nr:tyrosine-type recombinase/integrase [Magnetospirillum sp. XM-1]